MAEPTLIVINLCLGKVQTARWSVEFDGRFVHAGRTQTIADALIAVQLAIDEMRDEK